MGDRVAELEARVAAMEAAAKCAGFEFVPVPGGFTCVPQSPQVLVSTVEKLRRVVADLEGKLVEYEKRLAEGECGGRAEGECGGRAE